MIVSYVWKFFGIFRSLAQLFGHYKKEFYDIQCPVYISLYAEVILIASRSNKTERLGFDARRRDCKIHTGRVKT